MTVLVTGATGLLGSELVRQLSDNNEPVRALVRPSSRLTGIATANCEQVVGDLSDPSSLRRAVSGITTVYHCAARLGDWGSWPSFEEGTVHTTRHLVDACLAVDVERFVHVSSVAAYGHVRDADFVFTEGAPLGQNLRWWDHYARSKMLAERQARRLGQRLTIVRPSWLYGPGDRTILPRLIETLRQGRLKILGCGDNVMNMVHVADVAEGLRQAAHTPRASGQVYNLSSSGELTQCEFFELLAKLVGAPQVTGKVPLRVAYGFGFCCEAWGKVVGRRERPAVTRHGISLLSRTTNIASQKARLELGWQQRRVLRDELPQTVDWVLEHCLGDTSPLAHRDSNGTVCPK